VGGYTATLLSKVNILEIKKCDVKSHLFLLYIYIIFIILIIYYTVTFCIPRSDWPLDSDFRYFYKMMLNYNCLRGCLHDIIFS